MIVEIPWKDGEGVLVVNTSTSTIQISSKDRISSGEQYITITTTSGKNNEDQTYLYVRYKGLNKIILDGIQVQDEADNSYIYEENTSEETGVPKQLRFTQDGKIRINSSTLSIRK